MIAASMVIHTMPWYIFLRCLCDGVICVDFADDRPKLASGLKGKRAIILPTITPKGKQSKRNESNRQGQGEGERR